ncbi:hypothetical protein ABT364_04635 [Massilia sp. SR12]
MNKRTYMIQTAPRKDRFSGVAGSVLKVAPAIAICLVLASCDQRIDTRTSIPETKIELKLNGLRAVFLLPEAYKAEGKTGNLLVFRFKYPQMGPIGLGEMPQADEVSMFIELIEHGGSTERMVAEALDQFDSTRPAREYRAGEDGPYALYRQHIGRGATQTESTTYVFTGKDGALVGVNDPGRWSGSYEAVRRIAPNLQVKYLIAKPLGRDFIGIDEVVTAFIKTHRQN